MTVPAIIETTCTEILPAEPEETAAQPSTGIQRIKLGSGELVIDLTDPSKTFAAKGGDPILDTIRTKLEDLKPLRDPSTKAGRTAINSVVKNIGSVLKSVHESKLKHTEKLRLAKAMMDAEGKRIADAGKALQDDFRAPLTELEEAEEKEELEHRSALAAVVALRLVPTKSVGEATERLDSLGQYEKREWKGFKLKANAEIEATRKWLEAMIAELQRIEAECIAEEQRKLAEQLKAKKEREAKIAANAKSEAEAIAAKEQARLEAERLAADQRAEAAEKAKAETEANQEKSRIYQHKLNLQSIWGLGKTSAQQSIGQLQSRLERIKEFERRDWEEFADEAKRDVEIARGHVNDCIKFVNDAEQERQEAIAAEFKAKAEREQADAVQRALDAAEAERRKQAEADAERAANERIRDAVHARAAEEFRKLLQAIPADACPTAEVMADAVVDAIAALMIPNLKFTY